MKIGLHVTPFNWAMRRARERLGLSQKALADLVGVNPGYINGIECLRISVSNRMVREISLALGLLPEELFPPEIRKVQRVGSQAVEVCAEVASLDEARQNPYPLLEDQIDRAWLKRDLTEMLECLPERERHVIEHRFGIGTEEKTAEEVSDLFGVTRERIYQIESRALRTLRHPRRAARLRPYLSLLGRE